MRPIKVRPTPIDIKVANEVADTTGPVREKTAQAVSWGADEHVLTALAAGWWIYCLSRGQHQRSSTHLLLLAAVSAAVPHAAKHVFNQIRPDRLTARGHWRRVPLSGRRMDSFPSGHAVHMGALASAATAFPPKWRAASWGAAGVFCAARVLILAHWTSDVAAGLVVGVGIDRLLRRVTGFGRDQPGNTNAR
jgi:membrane-associated phospholipid phosphatase